MCSCFFSSPLAANRSFESKKSSILCRALWILGRRSSSKVPLWHSLLNCKFCSCMAAKNSKFNLNNKPWISKFNVVENMHWLKIISIFFEWWNFFQWLRLYLYKYLFIPFGLYFITRYCRMAIKMFHLELREFFSLNLPLQVFDILPDSKL